MFTRKLDTNQTLQDYVVDLTSPMVVIWAVSPIKKMTGRNVCIESKF